MRKVIDDLRRVQRRSRALLITQRVSVLCAWVVATILVLSGLDFVLRLPGTVRLVLVAAGAGTLGYMVWTYLRPALRFRPGLTQIALRAERLFPAVAGRLASSVEFASSGMAEENSLAARSVRDTEDRLGGESLRRVLSGGRTWRDTALLVFVAAIAVTVAAVSPASAQTALSRLFAPYGPAQWPARTGVVSLMDEVVGPGSVHPRGQALPLRARVTRGVPDHVGARYRLRVDGDWEPWQHIYLTYQGGDVHERLVDTTAEEIELYFETADAHTERERILLAAPPAVRRAQLSATPPPYASAWFQALEADLGVGLDDRAVTDTPLLVGSQVTLVLELNKPIPVPGDPEALAAALGWDGGDPPACTVDERDPARWTLQWRLAGSRTLNLHLRDEHGLTNTEPIGYRILAVEDRHPGVTVMQPEADEPVLATAVVPMVVEARDDVAVSSLGLEATRSRGGDEADEERLWGDAQWFQTPVATLSEDLELKTLSLSEGDVVLLRGVAVDVFELDGLRHPAVRSPPRRLRIIGELEMAQRFRRELGAVRQNAIRIEARQSELEEDVAAEGPQPGMERAQAQISERIAAQRQAVGEVLERMEQNRLADEQLQGLVVQAGDLLDYAGRAANRATGAIEERQAQGPAQRARPDAPEGEAPEAREPAEEDKPIVEAQREVRQELADLIALLDRDEDAWVATRRLEEMLENQGRLEEETGSVGRRTLGRSWDELSAGEQSELQRMAERQGDLADQARQIIEELRRRAEEMENADPQGASGMRAAADRGEQGELGRDMERAAERLAQNQMRTAESAQQSAQQTLQNMLQEMRDTGRASAQELLRRLASLIESIERLIVVQTGEIEALNRAIESGDFSGRDRAMIRLVQNTQAVAGEARSAGQDARRIARVLDGAADAQGAAVAVLRAQPPDGAAAREAEERSLERLREAAGLARELEQTVEQRELMRQRAQIVAAYRELAERQVAVRGDTLKLADRQPLDRRGLIEARGVAENQEQIRTGLEDLKAATPEIAESIVFSQVHRMMDGWATDVVEGLNEGNVEESISDRQQRIADSIGRLIGALEDLITPPGEFAQSQGGGAGGQSGGSGQPPLIPPLSELILLRGMQAQVYNDTQQLDRRGDLPEADRRRRLDELGREQRELLHVGEEMADALQAPAGMEQPGDEP